MLYFVVVCHNGSGSETNDVISNMSMYTPTIMYSANASASSGSTITISKDNTLLGEVGLHDPELVPIVYNLGGS